MVLLGKELVSIVPLLAITHCAKPAYPEQPVFEGRVIKGSYSTGDSRTTYDLDVRSGERTYHFSVQDYDGPSLDVLEARISAGDRIRIDCDGGNEEPVENGRNTTYSSCVEVIPMNTF